MSDTRLRTIALFAALCLFLSLVELMIPKPIPFFRLGLANLPILLALPLFSVPEVLLIVLLKVLGQGIVSGTLLSYVFLFSASGSFAAGLAMLLLRPYLGRWISLVGIGLVGALASNLVQLAVSALLIFGESTRLIAPLFLIAGSITGLIIGLGAELVQKHSHWIVLLRNGEEGGEGPKMPAAVEPRGEGGSLALFRLVLGLLCIPPFLLHSEMTVQALQLGICILLVTTTGRKFRPLPGLVVFVAVLTAHLLMPIGEVLFTFLNFPITRGAFEEGVHKGLSIVGLVYLSRFAVSKELRIPGTIGKLLYNVLFYFEELTAFRPAGVEGRRGGKRVLLRLFGEIDRFLIQKSLGTSGEDPTSTSTNSGGEMLRREASRLRAFLIPIALLLLQWGLFYPLSFIFQIN